MSMSLRVPKTIFTGIFLIFISSIAPSLAETPPAEVAPWQQLVDHLLQATAEQEANRDATCWTTVRMMEQFYSGMPISEAGALMRIEVSKVVVAKLWQKASNSVDSCVIDAEAVKAIAPEKLRVQTLADSPEALPRTRREFGIITENKRVVGSIIFAAVGDPQSQFRGLRALEPAAVDVLAKLATGLMIDILETAAKYATTAGRGAVGADDMKQAARDVMHAMSLDGDLSYGGTTEAMCADITSFLSKQTLLQMTRTNAENKVASLRNWNKKVWEKGDKAAVYADLLAELSPYPIDRQAVDLLYKTLREYLQFIAEGKRPLRSDTYAPYGLLFDKVVAADSPQGRDSYLDLEYIYDVTQDVFPRRTLVNGDVDVRLGAATEEVKDVDTLPEERIVKMRGFELDAVRDTTIHWLLIRDLWSSEKAMAMEPFAAELLAERISEMVWFAVLESVRRAKELGVERIDALIVGDVLKPEFYALAPEFPAAEWPASVMTAKAELQKRYSSPLFEERSAAAGIRKEPCYQPEVVEGRKKYRDFDIQRYSGSGVSAVDYDRDGKIDLFFPGEGCNRLYRNLGDFKFEDVTSKVGLLDIFFEARQALFGDFNGDGLLDLLAVHSNYPARLWQQSANGKFDDRSASSDLIFPKDAHTALAFDYDNDGDLDIYLGVYGANAPTIDGRNGGHNRLYRNDGSGHFEEVGKIAGVDSTGWTLAVSAVDIDSNGFQDLYVVNDFGYDELFLNDGRGHFTESGAKLGAADRGSGMNASVVDINQDGRFDLYVSVIDMFSKSLRFILPKPGDALGLDERIAKAAFFIAGNQLFVQQKNGEFAAETEQYFEPGSRGWGWSARFFDYDNDGDEDMYLANGWAEGSMADKQRNQLFINQNGRLFLVNDDEASTFVGNSRGVVAADFDGDGLLDLAVSNHDTGPKLFRNANKEKKPSFSIRLENNAKNRDAIGAEIFVLLRNGKKLSRLVSAGDAYLSQQPLEQHIGAPQDAVQQIEVRWPDGQRDVYMGPFTDKLQVIRRVKGARP